MRGHWKHSVWLVFVLGSVAAAQTPTPTITLEELERRAIELNPTIGQSRAAVSAAAGLAKQAGLYPNPTVSAVGEEIARGPIIRGGEIGAGFQQRIVTGGKLGLSRKVADQERAITQEMANVQRQRVLNAVRTLYYQAMSDQYRLRVRTNLSRLATEAVRISQELSNVGQADQPDLLAAEVESERIQLELIDAVNRQERTWRQLAAVVNDPTLSSPRPLVGDIEAVPRLELEHALDNIYASSPELRAAGIDVTRAETSLLRARKEPIPDLLVSGGVRYNRELLETTAAGIPRPVGKEGFFDIGVQLPIFNRNQGNIAAARADLERAKLDVDRTRLALRSRLAEAYREYITALARADRYKAGVLPKALKAYELYLNNVRQMAAAYPQALIAQRNLFQLQDAYVDALLTVWQKSVEIQGLLISGGVEIAPVALGPDPVFMKRGESGSTP